MQICKFYIFGTSGGPNMVALPYWLSELSRFGFTQICVARGIVSWESEGNDAAGELQLWYRQRDNAYCFSASKTARDMLVCKVIDDFTLHFQKCADKIKTLLTKTNTENK